MLISFDHYADGNSWLGTKEEQEAAAYEQWSRLTRALYGLSGPPPWRDLLSDQVLADLKAWNDAHDHTLRREDEEILPAEELEERGRELAIRVQDELGLRAGKCSTTRAAGYTGCTRRVAGRRNLAAGPSRLRAACIREMAEEEVRILEGLHADQQQG